MMALLLKPVLYIFSHIWHHCTTLGVLSSEKKSLSELSELLDLAEGFEERDRCLSGDSREHLKEFGQILAK